MTDEKPKEFIAEAVLEKPQEESELPEKLPEPTAEMEVTLEHFRARVGEDGRFYAFVKTNDGWNGLALEPEMALVVLDYFARVAMSAVLIDPQHECDIHKKPTMH